jgi:L,D-peptidoglycan transpeptidase YkuD (ErfK/YbiS/YcfS/YnhG family)
MRIPRQAAGFPRPAVLVAAVLVLTATSIAPAHAAARGAAGLTKSAAAMPGRTTQEIVVTGGYASHSAVLDTYQYGTGGWRHVLSVPAEVGYNGLSDNRSEGDGTTPTGTYGFGSTMYGLSSAVPTTKYAYHRLVCGDWWDENPASPTYNQFVHRACGAAGPGGDSEALWTSTVDYQHFALINFNITPTTPGRGAGIFLHDFTPSGVTAGCVALAPAQLDSVLRWLDPAQHPIIRIGTRAEVAAPAPSYVPPGGDLSTVLSARTGSGFTEVHTLTAASGFTAFRIHTATPLAGVSLARWQFQLGDLDGDGVPDLWAIDTQGGSGHTEVHVLSGASGYRKYILHAATTLPWTSLKQWTFAVADENGDGHADLYAVDTQDAGSGSTALFAWNGLALTQRLVAIATPLGALDLGTNTLLVGDWNGDGIPDLWMSGAWGRTAVSPKCTS